MSVPVYFGGQGGQPLLKNQGGRTKIFLALCTKCYQKNVCPPWPETLPAPMMRCIHNKHALHSIHLILLSQASADLVIHATHKISLTPQFWTRDCTTWTAPRDHQDYYSKFSAVLTVLERRLLGCRLDGTVATGLW